MHSKIDFILTYFLYIYFTVIHYYKPLTVDYPTHLIQCTTFLVSYSFVGFLFLLLLRLLVAFLSLGFNKL